MTKEEIEERLESEPFEPFRINTADGNHFEIVNPRLVVAMKTRVFIALPNERWTLIVLRQVTSLSDATPA